MTNDQVLIDGYNLLHALGLPAGKADLKEARSRLLGLLRAWHGDEAGKVTVVFDAACPPRGAPAEFYYQGIRVLFAVAYDEADDLIEVLIRRSPAPRHLTVVSDDHRIQQAARRRECAVLGCAAYLDWLDQQKRPRPAPPPATPAKPQAVSEEEARHWLQEFAELERGPEMKELFDPFGFEDAER
jgi:predicted RNA-binding protein with PIN domain